MGSVLQKPTTVTINVVVIITMIIIIIIFSEVIITVTICFITAATNVVNIIIRKCCADVHVRVHCVS